MIDLTSFRPPPGWLLLLLLAALVIWAVSERLERNRKLRQRARAAWLRNEHALRQADRPARIIPRQLALESDGRGSI